MYRYTDFDKKLRYAFSYLYRGIVITFSIYTLSNSTNYFQSYVYILSAVTYIVLFYLLSDKFRDAKKNSSKLNPTLKSKLRLVNDFLFILLVIWEKEIGSPAVLFLILLPIINSPNHSGKSASPFFVVIVCFFFFLYLGRSSYIFNESIPKMLMHLTIPSGLLLIIVGFEYIRSQLIRINEDFNVEVEKYYEANLQTIEKPHKILRNINDLINKESLILFKTEKLICFKLIDDTLYITGSTRFVFQYYIDDIKTYIHSLKEKGEAANYKITVDGKGYTNNVSFLIPTESCQFVFLLITSSSIHLFKNLLKPVFYRMAIILEFDNAINLQKKSSIEKWKNKIQFLDDAQMAMHFIKNKLSPITNFIAISEDFESLSTAAEKVKSLEHFRREREKVKTNLPHIIQKAQKFHDHADNPFSLSDFENCKAKKLVAIIRSNWNTYFSDEHLKIELDLNLIDSCVVRINEDLMDFLLTNWCSNMKKYNDGEIRLLIHESPDDFHVEFTNNICADRLKEANQFVIDFLSRDKVEILNRSKNRGLRELQYLLRIMSINHLLKIENTSINFLLTFTKKYENRDS